MYDPICFKKKNIYFFIYTYMYINAQRKTWKDILKTNYREGSMIRGLKKIIAHWAKCFT